MLRTDARHLKAEDPANKLGREQTQFTDVSGFVDTSGKIFTGMRVFKLLGAKGTFEDQVADPLLREGSIFTFRLARPGIPAIAEGALEISRGVDPAADFYPPEFKISPDYPYGAPKIITADEGFAVVKRFDELFFPNQPVDVRYSNDMTEVELAAMREMEEALHGASLGFSSD